MRVFLFSVVVALVLASCGGGMDESLYSRVYLSFSTETGGERIASAVPPEVSLIQIIVEAPDMPTIEEAFEIVEPTQEFRTSILVPKGLGRHFIALAIDQEGLIIFKGDTVVDLLEDEVNLVISMERIEPTPIK